MDATARTSGILIGVLCGTGASIGWAAGFVAAKHGIAVGFSPADLAFHRFFWSGLLLMPLVLREGLRDLGGIGWRRGLVMSMLAGPPQVDDRLYRVHPGAARPRHHHPAGLRGAVRADPRLLVLHEKPTVQRMIGGATIIAGLMVFGAESLATIGGHGVGGDLLFATAGLFWATFGILLRYWHVSGTRAIAVVGAFSILVYRAAVRAIRRLSAACCGWGYGKSDSDRGAGPARRHAADLSVRARGDPARRRARRNISGAGAGFRAGDRLSALGVVPSLAQLVGMVIVLVGFRFALR